tara:strand:- start:107 stop:454 length:348 start_codon:yes stop_codon:yes gene_type:complete
MKNKTIKNETATTNNFASFKVQGNGRRFSKDAVIKLHTITDANKLPHQAQCILHALATAENNLLTIEQLIGKDAGGLNSALDKVEAFNTVQTPAKIWQFYQSKLIKGVSSLLVNN